MYLWSKKGKASIQHPANPSLPILYLLLAKLGVNLNMRLLRFHVFA